MARKKKEEEIVAEIPTVWVTFFNKIKEINDLDIKDWKPTHYMGYICKKYKEQYSTSYIFSYDKAPGKSKEGYFVKLMCASLINNKPQTIKEYIDWIFSEKISKRKLKIRSWGLFTTSEFLNEFNMIRKQNQKVYKYTKIPDEYRKFIGDLPIDTYGDLAFVKQSLKQDFDSESKVDYRVLFSNLLYAGFEESILDDLK